ncbi:NUDIX domain-containing protein [Deinococcus deserti]|uniref:Putative NUDIX hydrolase n=1 Tax=Deinococcus deserti (strain DSM 17065 / CIP 109153 / LMG 22923 / VCD115) TaxID=546414 RepID=C1CYT4_DEIDV|nr:NUDIX domain-containing protein [Deinococcus deserti]ACO47114.1 putative NUDIX hydrolase [Deinococcus deserti VCD115]
MRARAAGILLNAQREVLLMRRCKEGRISATLPGSGIEEGETPAQACVRELLEGVNLVVDVHEEVLTPENQDNREHGFGGAWRNGPQGVRHSEENWYNPEWVSVDDLDAVSLVPAELRPLIRTLLETA